jgi:hypothetical protein
MFLFPVFQVPHNYPNMGDNMFDKFDWNDEDLGNVRKDLDVSGSGYEPRSYWLLYMRTLFKIKIWSYALVTGI